MRPPDSLHESNFRVHEQCSNTMYEWAMWRMKVNDRMSREIVKQDRKSRKRSRFASNMFSERVVPNHSLVHRVLNETGSGSPHLVGSMYLVYGLPRVTVRRPRLDIRELHGPSNVGNPVPGSLNGNIARPELPNMNINTPEQADKHTHSTSKLGFVNPEEDIKPLNVTMGNVSNSNNEEAFSESQSFHNTVKDMSHASTSDVTSDNNVAPVATLRNGTKQPFVRRGRVFWENLARNKAAIIGLNEHNDTNTDVSTGVQDKDTAPAVQYQNGHIPPPPPLPSEKKTEEHLLSDDILKKQYTLLKKTREEAKPRNSKAMWRSLADRKTDILQMRDISPSGQRGDSKRNEGRTKSLWGFLFSKDKELKALIKNKHKVNRSESVQKSETKGHAVKGRGNEPRRATETGPMSFQEELEARVRRRRQQEEQAQS